MEAYIGTTLIFAGNFAPRNWAFCDGQLLSIEQNTALFSLIGTTYGGDGRTTTALPNLQGRVPMHPGRGPGLTSRRLGEVGGATEVTLSETQIPPHSHSLSVVNADTEEEGQQSPGNAALGRPGPSQRMFGANANMANMSGDAVGTSGGNSAHNNMQPYLALNYIIALQGFYPSRS